MEGYVVVADVVDIVVQLNAFVCVRWVGRCYQLAKVEAVGN
jgi:hypothetical protein